MKQLETHEDVIHQRLLIPQILSKFHVDTVTKLEESKKPSEIWTVKSVREALKHYVKIRENVHRRASNTKKMSNHQSRVMERRSSSEALSVAASIRPVDTEKHTTLLPCVFCNDKHYNENCAEYKSLPARKQRLRELGRCFICLQKGHTFTECCNRHLRKCYHCKQSGHHNRALCPRKTNDSKKRFESVAVTTDIQLPKTQDDGDSTCSGAANTTQNLAIGENVLLQTVQSLVVANDQSVMLRLLLDSASHRTFMTERLAKKLQLPVERKESLSVSTFAANHSKELDTYIVKFDVILKDGSSVKLEANVLKQLTRPIHRRPLQSSDIQFLKALSPECLADSIPETSETANIDILIGADYFWQFINGHKIVLPSGMFLIPSKLGYLLTGKYPELADDHNKCIHTYYVMTQMSQAISELNFHSVPDTVTIQHNSLEDFWSLEAIGIKDTPYTNDDDVALERFNTTILFQNGRYQITWPWKSGHKCYLPDNLSLAFGRMKLLSKRLQNDRSLLNRYDQVIKDQLNQGIIERVTETESSSVKHYLPHHPVLTPTKETTKLRIVYDGSSKPRKELKSLNECLHRGPILLPNLCGLLLRFRTYKIPVLADIEKAFLQIEIQSKERDVTRFLWFKDVMKPDEIEGNLATYRFCRVPFGLICSPFLLEGTLKFHLQREGSSIAQSIAENIYVDSILVGADSPANAYRLFERARQIFKEATMNLQQWTSNSLEFLSLIPDDLKVKGSIVKVLGITWNTLNDELTILESRMLPSDQHTTKREILQHIARIYDPLGLIAPVTFYGKVFMQKLWKANVSWDEKLSPRHCDEWSQICNKFQSLSILKIPRLSGAIGKDSHCQVVVFNDASMKSYAAAVYLLVKNGESIKVNLLFSKMRLTSIQSVVANEEHQKEGKKLTLPRLDLLSTVIGVRAGNFVKDQLKLQNSKLIVFTDSQCVLHWLKTPKPLSTFVGNRIKEMRQSNAVFRYVPSNQNPADFATRGMSASELEKIRLWWHGPEWLTLSVNSWPNYNVPEVNTQTLDYLESETNKSNKIYVATNFTKKCKADLESNECDNSPFRIDEKRFSSLQKLIRVTSYCVRFIQKRIWSVLRKETQETMSSRYVLIKQVFREHSSYATDQVHSVCMARILWEYAVQNRQYLNVLNDMRKGKRNNLQRQLGLQIDEWGLLRCYGRYSNANLSFNAKYPKLIPRLEYFTHLVIKDAHERMLHSGVSHTLAQVRQVYWIPQGKRETKGVVSRCTICRRYEGPPYALPPMPSLPRDRVSKSEPSQSIGLDYLGPILVKEGRERIKFWVCLFTCLAIRAIHLEWIRNLTASQFLCCFRRFVARRGKPRHIISDNASQFKLTAKVLDRQWQ